MQHDLKILPQYFKAVQEGTKTFEIRENDRGLKVGDTLLLKEYETNYMKGYTGREITKEISYILEGGQYGLEEGYCILGLKEPFEITGNCSRCESFPIGIELKNINLTGISKLEQFEKVNEEKQELIEAVKEYLFRETEENKNNAISEYFDLVQSALGLLDKFGIKAEEVMKEYPKHLEKLKNRPRQKLCSKCDIFSICLESDTLKNYDEYAKECEIYKEREE